MNVYLAGDSIVQDYTDEEFIAGWGQYLPYYIASGNNVINYAKGGRHEYDRKYYYIGTTSFLTMDKRIIEIFCIWDSGT